MCREPTMKNPKLNRRLSSKVLERNRALAMIPEIPENILSGINLQKPIASGSYADVYKCSWKQRNVVIKRLRINPNTNQADQIKKETSLAISLLHPNVVKVFGTTKFSDGLLGIVLEYADKGDLSRKSMDKLSLDQKIRVSYDICSALGVFKKNTNI